MKKKIKQLIKSLPLYQPVRNWLTHRKQIKELHEWEGRGKPLPLPHILKQGILRGYIEKYDLKIMVETGTYFGDMVEALRKSLTKVYSIELSEYLASEAQRRFKASDNVIILQGDSGKEIEKVLNDIKLPTLFWLDGHYSAGITAKGENETPIFAELTHIFSAPDLGHVILIDDARAFGKIPDYPTLDALKSFILTRRNKLEITIHDDIIRVTPA
jgi:hypothetical protein